MVSQGENVNFGLGNVDYTRLDPPSCRSYLEPLALVHRSRSNYADQTADIVILTVGSRLDGRVGAGFAAFLPPNE